MKDHDQYQWLTVHDQDQVQDCHGPGHASLILLKFVEILFVDIVFAHLLTLCLYRFLQDSISVPLNLTPETLPEHQSEMHVDL